MVEHAKAKGVNATWLPVPGGQHVDAWAQPEIIGQTFDFFDKYRARGGRAGTATAGNRGRSTGRSPTAAKVR
jgi:hypothetical protein